MKIRTTPKRGGLLLGCNPRVAGPRLKTPALTVFRPHCVLTRGGRSNRRQRFGLAPRENGSSYSFTLSRSSAMSAFSCSRMYLAIVASFRPTVDT